MDCGEGTFGQLVRLYGIEKTNDILMNLKAVYVSHLHADHHIGFIRILLARDKVFDHLQKRVSFYINICCKKLSRTNNSGLGF